MRTQYLPAVNIYSLLFRLYGDYESLTYGYVADALVDMTGGVSEKLVVSELELDKPENKVELLNKLLRANQQKAFIVCRIEVCTVGAQFKYARSLRIA